MTLAERLSARVPPDAAITNAAHRLLLAIRVPRGGRSEGHASRALARATRTTALGRFPAAERVWIDRIEARRRQLTREHVVFGRPRKLWPLESARELWSPPRAWSIPRVWGRFLLRFVAELAPGSCIELGTGFGMSALYQGAALEITDGGTLVTLDQEESLIPFAREGFAQLGLDGRIELTSGPIGQTLGSVAERQAPIDYAFIDAEHTEAATTENFDALRPHLSDGAVVLVDDIRTTPGMRRAWATIQARPGILHAFDLRRLGIVVTQADRRSRRRPANEARPASP